MGEYIDVEYVEVIEENNLLTKEYLQENPSIIGAQIANLAKSIEDAKSNIEKIKSRNLWERLITNNTKDLSEVMLKQNETTTAFLAIVQGIIFLSMNNIATLATIMNAIEMKEDEDSIKDNKYISMAKDYLIEAIKSAKKIQNNENEINEIKDKLLVTDYNYKKQSSTVGVLEKWLNETRDELQRQAICIKKQNESIELQKLKNNNQDKTLENIKKELEYKSENDKKKSDEIDIIKTNLNSQIEVNNNNLNSIKEITARIDEQNVQNHYQFGKIKNNENTCLDLNENIKKQEMIIENLRDIQETNIAKINTLENTIQDISKKMKIKSYFLIVFIVALILVKI